MANFFHSVGYPAENVHTGMIAYLCDLWNEGEREPLSPFLDRLGVALEAQTGLRANREYKRIDLAIFDAENDSPVVAIEMKVDSHEGLVKGVPQTIAYPKRLPEGTPFLFVTLGVGEFYHAPQGERARWIGLRHFHEAVEAIPTDDPFIERWRKAIGKEVDLQDKCFSGDWNSIEIEEYRGKTWSLYSSVT